MRDALHWVVAPPLSEIDVEEVMRPGLPQPSRLVEALGIHLNFVLVLPLPKLLDQLQFHMPLSSI